MSDFLKDILEAINEISSEVNQSKICKAITWIEIHTHGIFPANQNHLGRAIIIGL